MTQPPTFSVIIPTLNEEKFLPNLLRSLADQSKKDFEVIVVDDCSKDKTRTIAKSYGHKVFTVFCKGPERTSRQNKKRE